jgi:single-stranded-DNA-specific exonuclease
MHVSSAQRWYLRRAASADIASLYPGLDPILARVLYARRIDTPDALDTYVHAAAEPGNPYRMAGMNEAVARLRQALTRNEPIVVYGDYDVDGVSAAVLLVSALRMLGGQVSYYVPDRFSEAYGLNKPALEYLYHERCARLVVTVDCGIRSPQEVAHAQALGLDMIITDHHSVPTELPPALAVIDPKRPDCPYPFKELAGVGVAYRLADALCRVQSRMTAFDTSCLDGLLDLVALGTVADIVPLRDENRWLVRRGLEQMRANPRPGLRALMDVAGVKVDEVDSQAIAFRLGPRLNAAGRLQHASLAYDLLMAESYDVARPLAEQLNEVNQDRQAMLEQQVEEARQRLGTVDGRPLLVVHSPDFHEGLVGLIASRLTEEYYRPSLVMRAEGEDARGSARSIEGFHVTHALDTCADLLSRYGGHERAAGFSLPSGNITELSERLMAYAAERLDEATLSRRYSVDALVRLGELSMDTPAVLRMLEPVGEGNPEPALASTGLLVRSVRAVGKEANHLRLEVAADGCSLSAIAFRQGHLAADLRPGSHVDLIYRPDLNEWQGRTSLQLMVSALRLSTTTDDA